MNAVRDGARVLAKRAQGWLRNDRRLERALHTATRLEGPATRYSHELIVPMTSTYSPWYDDAGFRKVYDAIEGYTLVDQYKCYELWEQLGQLSHVEGDVLEVGVWRGGTGVLLASRSESLGFETTVYLADTFAGVVKAGAGDPWYRGGEHSDTSPSIVRDLAARLDVDVELLIGVFPDESSAAVDGRRFRFVHIDVDVYQSARDVLLWAWPKLSQGGVVVWDDYGSFECEGVAQLGRELFELNLSHGRLVHNANGHLLLMKLSDGTLELKPIAPEMD